MDRGSARKRGTLRVTSCMAPNADAMCRALSRYLARNLAMRVDFVDDIPWQERERLFDAGAIDLCWICGLPYVHKADRAEGVELCVAPVMQGTRYGGAPIYFSDVVVRKESAFQSFAGLEGLTWAYNEPRSHSGFNLVCYYLAAQGKTLAYFGRLVEAGAHQSALRLILSGEVAAAAIDSTVLEAEMRLAPALANEIRTIATLGPSPAPPWVFSKDVPATLRAEVRECLRDMSRDAAGRAVLESWGVSELRPVDDRAYDPIRAMARTAATAAPVTA